jgi:hypothetical protein
VKRAKPKFSKPLTPLPVWQYNFHQLSQLPAEHLRFCFAYEYAREVPRILEAFKADKEAGRGFDEHGNWHFVVYVPEPIPNATIDFPPAPAALVLEPLDAPPGFPDKPYLQTKHIITERAYEPFYPPGRGPTPVASVEWNGVCWLAKEPKCPREHVYFLGIDWTKPETALRDAFVSWMRENKPPYMVAEMQTGKDERDKWFTLLKALGVYRLARHYGTVAEAFRQLDKLGQTGVLYSHEADWNRAKKQAERVIALWGQTSTSSGQ